MKIEELSAMGVPFLIFRFGQRLQMHVKPFFSLFLVPNS